MLSDLGPQLDLSTNGRPEVATRKAISAGFHPPIAAAQEPAGSSPMLPGAGGKAEGMEGYCCCAGASRCRDRGPGGALWREQGDLRGVGQSWLWSRPTYQG